MYNPRILTCPHPRDLAAEVATIERAGEAVPDIVAAGEAVPDIVAAGSARIIRISALDATSATILKQELHELGGHALISPLVYAGDRAAHSDALIFASLGQLAIFTGRLRRMPLPALQTLATELDATLAAYDAPRGTLTLAGHTFTWGARTYIMGVLNITPDSFSGDGLALRDDVVATALEQARRFAAEGADILDVGGESTRPGAQQVSVDAERARVVPVVAALARELQLPISIDSYHAEVVAAALDAGAHLINAVWGLRLPNGGWNEPLAALTRERGVPLVLMHNRRAQASSGSSPGSPHYPAVHYNDLMGEIVSELRAGVAYAQEQGIARELLLVDPGIGFGKTPAQNLVLLRRLAELKSIGLPILLGTSRKSFIGLALGLPADQRDEGTAATTALGIQAGADIVRVHNVQLNARVARMTDALTR